MTDRYMAFANQISRTLIAAGMKRGDNVSLEKLHNEKYQRTMSDEYPFSKRSGGRFMEVDDQQKRQWLALANHNERGRK